MAASASSPYISNTLANTPTWAVGVVCIIIVLASFFLELGLKKLNMYFERTHQKPLQETLLRMKEVVQLFATVCMWPYGRNNTGGYGPGVNLPLYVFPPCAFLMFTVAHSLVGSYLIHMQSFVSKYNDVMMLGFISLMLVITRDSLAKICVPNLLSDYMLPCSSGGANSLSTSVSTCSQSETPLMSTESLHQLHMFIFVMAIVHVCYSCITMILARLQIKGWRHWEEEIRNQDASIDSAEVCHKSHFLVDRVHGNPWSAAVCLCWIDSFFRQFWNPVKKSDYINLRRGFVKSHNAGPKFNFLHYMMRTMEDDFKTIVAIRAYLWMFVIVFMLLNVHGWYTYFWIAFIPFMLLLIIGTKLQHVITSLALEIVNSDGKIGDSVKPRDELFWFNKPEFVLHLIHFILFQNSFELAYFIWIWTTYGLDSCFMEKRGFVYARVALGFVSQIICSYTTLPLYALVTQMGSSYKKAILPAPVAQSLLEWHHKAKLSKKMRTLEENEQLKFQSSFSIEAKDSSDLSQFSEDSRVSVSENKGGDLLPQKCSSDLPSIKEELKQHDSPETIVQEEHLSSSVNRASGTGSLAEAETKRPMLTTSGQSNADICSGFVSVVINSQACKQESFRQDHLET